MNQTEKKAGRGGIHEGKKEKTNKKKHYQNTTTTQNLTELI